MGGSTSLGWEHLLPDDPPYLLLTTYYALLATHYLLLTTYYSLAAQHLVHDDPPYLLLTTYYSLLATHYLLRTTCYALLTTHSPLSTWCITRCGDAPSNGSTPVSAAYLVRVNAGFSLGLG